jgi:hypothetical protein
VGQEDEHRTETVQYTAPELGMPQLVERTAQNLASKSNPIGLTPCDVQDELP